MAPLPAYCCSTAGPTAGPTAGSTAIATAGSTWSPPATRSEAVARVGDLFPDNLEGQGRVFRALAPLPDGEMVNLFAAPSREAVVATLMNVLAESTGESCLGNPKP